MITRRSALTVVPLITLVLLIGLRSNLRGEVKDQRHQLVGSWDITICASDPCTPNAVSNIEDFRPGWRL